MLLFLFHFTNCLHSKKIAVFSLLEPSLQAGWLFLENIKIYFHKIIAYRSPIHCMFDHSF